MTSLEQQGIACFNKGDFSNAIVLFSRAIQADRTNPRLLFNLGTAFQRKAEHSLAVQAFKAATALLPDYAAAFNNMGLSLLELGFHQKAADAFHRAVDINPNLFEAWGNLGNAERTAGRLEEALSAFERAMRLKPKSAEAARSYILTKMYDLKTTDEDLISLCREYEKHHALKPKAVFFKNDKSLGRKLRIGYLSSDFRDHPVGHNLAPLFFNHDRERFETYLYAEVSTVDFMTEAFRDAACVFRETPNRSDDEVAAMIRKDRIDILVFLAGFLDANRSLIAAKRSAPIQVSLHDAATSGLATMDYWIGDPFCTPMRTTEGFTERLIRIPRLLVYRPIPDAPDPAPAPCLTSGRVAFCSMNNPAKMNDEVIALFAAVLQAVPDASLLLKYSGIFDSEIATRHFLDRFAAHGIDRERVRFRFGKESRAAHLLQYKDADIALDTFPFNGVTTTFEALWMGVPVVTLPQSRFIGRAAGSILHSMGFEQGIARDKADYVQKARSLAGSFQTLDDLRRTMRDRMRCSPLMDERRYARNIERIFLAMWRMFVKK